jgi:hypothetical protein
VRAATSGADANAHVEEHAAPQQWQAIELQGAEAHTWHETVKDETYDSCQMFFGDCRNQWLACAAFVDPIAPDAMLID